MDAILPLLAMAGGAALGFAIGSMPARSERARPIPAPDVAADFVPTPDQIAASKSWADGVIPPQIVAPKPTPDLLDRLRAHLVAVGIDTACPTCGHAVSETIEPTMMIVSVTHRPVGTSWAFVPVVSLVCKRCGHLRTFALQTVLGSTDTAPNGTMPADDAGTSSQGSPDSNPTSIMSRS